MKYPGKYSCFPIKTENIVNILAYRKYKVKQIPLRKYTKMQSRFRFFWANCKKI